MKSKLDFKYLHDEVKDSTDKKPAILFCVCVFADIHLDDCLVHNGQDAATVVRWHHRGAIHRFDAAADWLLLGHPTFRDRAAFQPPSQPQQPSLQIGPMAHRLPKARGAMKSRPCIRFRASIRRSNVRLLPSWRIRSFFEGDYF
jgi:hypothetical protein